MGKNPFYINDSNDIPNGACIEYVNHKKASSSLTTCHNDGDCFESLSCKSGWCTDKNGVREVDRTVQTCVSPKTSDSGSKWSGCGFSDRNNILNCHKYWIGDKGM